MVASEEKSTGNDTASRTADGIPCWAARRLRPTRAGPMPDSANTGSTRVWGTASNPPRGAPNDGGERVVHLGGGERTPVPPEVEDESAAIGLHGDECHHRGGDEIDGHHVEGAEVGHRQPQRRRQASERREVTEEVVGAVDLVHLAGARVADHDRGPVHAPPQALTFPDDPFGLELGPMIGRRKTLSDFEIGFGEPAAEVAGHRDRGDVMEQASWAMAKSATREVPMTLAVRCDSASAAMS